MKFLFCAKKAKGGKACSFINFFSLLALVFNMSLFGVFFIAQPQAQAQLAPGMCSADVDVVLVMDRSGSMADGGSLSQCDWESLEWTGSSFQCISHKASGLSELECQNIKNTDPHPLHCNAPVFTPSVPNKLEDAIDAANSFLNNLGSNDQSALVSFADTATTDKALSGDHGSTQTAVNVLTPNGGTNIGDAIDLANIELNSASANPQANKVMILLTDGKANKPNGNGYDENQADIDYAEDMAAEAASQGFKIFTIGLGNDVNAIMLGNIAGITGAEYYFAPDSSCLGNIYNQISTRICQYSSISGYKYLDSDGDGDIAGEAPIAGWEIVLGGDASRTKNTDANGYYSFFLPPGNYTVSETASSAYTQTFPLVDKTYDICLGTEENITDINFGNYLIPAIPTGTIRGCKWLDENRDGFWASTTEITRLPGWTIELREAGTLNFIASATTSDIDTQTIGKGCYEFIDVPYGEYEVSEVLQSGWIQTFPDASATVSFKHKVFIDMNTPDHSGIDFGNYEIICGDGYKDGQEACDDGNNVSGDGCSAACITEGGGGPSGPVCGNNIKESGEECDGSDTPSDRECSDNCTLVPLGNTLFPTFRTGGAVASVPGESGGTAVLGEEGAPVLTITKSIDQGFVNPGDENIIYTVNVANTGNLSAFNVIITDILPDGLAFSDGSGVEKSWEIGDLAPGESKEISYGVNISENAEAKDYTNTVTAMADNHDPVTAEADLTVEAVAVLAETGFRLIEFILLAFASVLSLGIAMVTKRKYENA